MRLVANREPVGQVRTSLLKWRTVITVVSAVANTAAATTTGPQELGIRYDGSEDSRDVFVEGDCDECFVRLAQELGLMDDLLSRYGVLPEASQELLDGIITDAAEEAEEGRAAEVD